jgi:hypothetical protein
MQEAEADGGQTTSCLLLDATDDRHGGALSSLCRISRTICHQMRTLLAPRDAITKPLAVASSAVTIAAAYFSYVFDLADMKFA